MSVIGWAGLSSDSHRVTDRTDAGRGNDRCQRPLFAGCVAFAGDVTTPWDERVGHFAKELGSRLRVEEEVLAEVGPDTDLFGDWGLDSLQAFEMIIVIEAMAGATMPPPIVPELYTVTDAYAYFQGLKSDVIG